MDKWARDILDKEGLNDWQFKWTSSDGLTLRDQKMIWCASEDKALFLHEVAHALGSKEEDLKEGDKTGHRFCFHHARWALRYTDLVRKYLVGQACAKIVHDFREMESTGRGHNGQTCREASQAL